MCSPFPCEDDDENNEPVETIDFFDVSEQRLGVLGRESYVGRPSDVVHIALVEYIATNSVHELRLLTNNNNYIHGDS